MPIVLLHTQLHKEVYMWYFKSNFKLHYGNVCYLLRWYARYRLPDTGFSQLGFLWTIACQCKKLLIISKVQNIFSQLHQYNLYLGIWLSGAQGEILAKYFHLNHPATTDQVRRQYGGAHKYTHPLLKCIFLVWIFVIICDVHLDLKSRHPPQM